LYFFLIFLMFDMHDFILKSFKDFTFFIIGNTKEINGYIVKKKFNEGMDGDTYNLTISYKVNQSTFLINELLSAYTVLSKSKMDSIEIRYNIKNPSIATSDKITVISTHFLLSLFLVTGSLYSIIFLSRKILMNIK